MERYEYREVSPEPSSLSKKGSMSSDNLHRSLHNLPPRGEPGTSSDSPSSPGAKRVPGSHEIGIPAGEHEATTASNKSGTDTEASGSVVEQSHDSADDGKQLHGDANQTQIENMAIAIPPRFDEEFLDWFRKRTEEMWQRYQTRSFAYGYDWQQGTHWSNGLNEQELVTIEQRYQIRFPPDYRLFLQMLHSVDRPKVVVGYDGNTKIPPTAPSIYHWQRDTEAIQHAYEWLVDGLFFDVQGGWWLKSWGVKPSTAEEQKARLQELVDAAPKLIPIYGHRYLLAEPCKAGNPVLSIYQSDIIVYGVDLHDYFLKEFPELTGLGRTGSSQITQALFEEYKKIPFWGELLC